MRKYLPDDAVEGNAAAVIAVTVISLVLVESDNLAHVLGNVAILPAQLQELVEMLKLDRIAFFHNFW